jgi:hypothetical protein
LDEIERVTKPDIAKSEEIDGITLKEWISIGIEGATIRDWLPGNSLSGNGQYHEKAASDGRDN